MLINIIVFLSFLLISSSVFSGAFCLCGGDHSRGSKEPLMCNGACPVGCLKEYDSSQDDYYPIGCNESGGVKLCNYGSQCVSEIFIGSTGYKSGHKTWWCRSVGFDGVKKDALGNDVCFRDCGGEDAYKDAKGCVKIAMGCLGYREGHKSKFCKRNGYPHAFHHPKANENPWLGVPLVPGICYRGEPKVCAWEVEKEVNVDPIDRMPDPVQQPFAY